MSTETTSILHANIQNQDNSPIEISEDVAASLEAEARSARGTAVMDINDSSVHFDVEVVVQGLTECLKQDCLIIDGYLRAYTEITKFFEVLGPVFNFVASDVHQKLNVLRCYRKGGSGEFYSNIESMLQYQQDQPDLTQPTAARTLLRLHRALAFVCGFLKALQLMQEDGKLGGVMQEVYANTLARHHGWLLSKTVSALLLLVPTKRVMLVRLVGDDVARIRQMEERLPTTCDLLQKVYDATEEFFKDFDMLNLP